MAKAAPLYVTRPLANGDVGYFAADPFVILIIGILLIINMGGWGIYGFVELLGKIAW